jgi:hypothetical protein
MEEYPHIQGFCMLIARSNTSSIQNFLIVVKYTHGTTLIGRLFDEGTLCRLGMAIEMKLDVSNIPPVLR